MKKILSMLLVAVLLFGMVGCGGQTSKDDTKQTSDAKTESKSTSTKSTTESTGKITLKIANYAILEKGYTEFWENAKTKFEEK